MKIERQRLRQIISEELKKIDAHCADAWEQTGKDEFFVKTGEDDGLTLKVLRGGR